MGGFWGLHRHWGWRRIWDVGGARLIRAALAPALPVSEGFLQIHPQTALGQTLGLKLLGLL